MRFPCFHSSSWSYILGKSLTCHVLCMQTALHSFSGCKTIVIPVTVTSWGFFWVQHFAHCGSGVLYGQFSPLLKNSETGVVDGKWSLCVNLLGLYLLFLGLGFSFETLFLPLLCFGRRSPFSWFVSFLDCLLPVWREKCTWTAKLLLKLDNLFYQRES